MRRKLIAALCVFAILTAHLQERIKMKKKLLMVTLCILVALTACSNKKTDEENQPAESETTETQEEKETETQPEEEESVPEEQGGKAEGTVGEKNDTSVYPEADLVTDVAMGSCIDGKQTALCTVKIPTNYIFGSLYLDENGERQAMKETDGKLVTEVIASDGSIANRAEVPDTLVLSAQGSVDNKYTFAIVDSKTISVESEKEYAPGGIDVNTGNGHDAYVHVATGQFDVVFVYEINEDWSLLIQNSGQLKDELSIEEIGQEFYKVVTPVQ